MRTLRTSATTAESQMKEFDIQGPGWSCGKLRLPEKPLRRRSHKPPKEKR